MGDTNTHRILRSPALEPQSPLHPESQRGKRASVSIPLKSQPTNGRSLPFLFHWSELVTWAHLTQRTLGNAVPDWTAVWQLPLHTMKLGGQILVDKQTFLTQSIFCIFFHEKKEYFLLSPRNSFSIRWHGNFSSFFGGFFVDFFQIYWEITNK